MRAPQLALRVNGRAPFRVVTVIAPEGCEAAISLRQETAVIRLSGLYDTLLTLRGETIERT